MTRMTGPDCAVMCNFINTHTHTHTKLKSGPAGWGAAFNDPNLFGGNSSKILNTK